MVADSDIIQQLLLESSLPMSLFDPIAVLNTLHEQALWEMARLKTTALVLWIQQPPRAMFWPRGQLETQQFFNKYMLNEWKSRLHSKKNEKVHKES